MAPCRQPPLAQSSPGSSVYRGAGPLVVGADEPTARGHRVARPAPDSGPLAGGPRRLGLLRGSTAAVAGDSDPARRQRPRATRCINAFAGKVGSTAFRALSIPTTGSVAESSRPIWTR